MDDIIKALFTQEKYVDSTTVVQTRLYLDKKISSVAKGMAHS